MELISQRLILELDKNVREHRATIAGSSTKCLNRKTIIGLAVIESIRSL
jgi:hypothetical protein